MDTSVDRPASTISVPWRFALAVLFGVLVGTLGGLTASTLSEGLLVAALLARPLFQFSALRAWWRAVPPSKRGHVGFTDVMRWVIEVVGFVLISLPTFFWEVPVLLSSVFGLGSPSPLIGLVGSIVFGLNERSRRAFGVAIGLGAAVGLGALLGFLVISPVDLLTLQLAGAVLLLATGGGLLGALIWLGVSYIAKSGKAETPPPESLPAPAPTLDEAAIADQQLFSRRAVLAGAAKGAALLAAGASMTLATRAFIPQFLPLYVYRGHNAPVYAVAWSPDGSLIASAGRDKTVQVWKPFQPTAPVLIYRGHTDVVFSLAWSPDGKQIATGGRDRHLILPSIHVWDAASGSLNFRYSGHQDQDVSVHALAWSPNSRWIASVTSDQTVHIWQPTW